MGQLNIIQYYNHYCSHTMSIRRTIQHKLSRLSHSPLLKMHTLNFTTPFQTETRPPRNVCGWACSSLNSSKNQLFLFHLLRYPLAFTLSELTQICICEERLQKYTNRCDINYQTIESDGDFWVGYIYMYMTIDHPDLCFTPTALLSIAKQN